jgi:hypothetical protein
MKRFCSAPPQVGLSAILAIMLLAISPRITASDTGADDGERVAQKRPLVLGPFNVGDWFDNTKLELDGPFNVCVPPRNEIIKSLNDCQAYIIDERISSDGKKPKFGEVKLAVTGKLYHKWQTKKGDYVIQIAELKTFDLQTNYADAPPWRSVKVNIGLECAGSNPIVSTKSTFYFTPEVTFRYTIDGKLD